MFTVSIAKTFSTTPGPRLRSEGDHSGEDFRERILKPRFEEAQRQKTTLLVDLDGVKYGYPTSFLEEAFGGLARQCGVAETQRVLAFISSEEPMLEQEIRTYIADATKTSKQRIPR